MFYQYPSNEYCFYFLFLLSADFHCVICEYFENEWKFTHEAIAKIPEYVKTQNRKSECFHSECSRNVQAWSGLWLHTSECFNRLERICSSNGEIHQIHSSISIGNFHSVSRAENSLCVRVKNHTNASDSAVTLLFEGNFTGRSSESMKVYSRTFSTAPFFYITHFYILW